MLGNLTSVLTKRAIISLKLPHRFERMCVRFSRRISNRISSKQLIGRFLRLNTPARSHKSNFHVPVFNCCPSPNQKSNFRRQYPVFSALTGGSHRPARLVRSVCRASDILRENRTPVYLRSRSGRCVYGLGAGAQPAFLVSAVRLPPRAGQRSGHPNHASPA